MRAPQPESDLIVLVADKDMEFAVKGILTRCKSLSIREVSADIYPHPQRDPGCARRCHDFLRAFSKQYRHALVMFDLDGSGNPGRSREELEADIEARLSAAGWHGRSAAVVLDPELEAWVWSDSPEVAKILGWPSSQGELRSWLIAKRFRETDRSKPVRPKEAMEAVLHHTRRRRSSSLYFELARRVSIRKCTDTAFAKLTGKLREWFAMP